MSRIRVIREIGRACDGCEVKHQVLLLLALGSKSVRVCGRCWQLLADARQRVFIEQLESLEVMP